MKVYLSHHHQFACFALAVLVCFAFNLLAVKCNSDSYREGQRVIVESYESGMAKIDSLQKQNEDALNRVLVERERTITKILSDTTLDKAQGLCPQQKDAVRKYIRPYLEVVSRELNVKETIKSAPDYELEMLKDEIKSLLQLEFNKVQNEYEALEIWAAILTIVFLIFSFYSFFKTESLEEQGRQGKAHIEQMEKDARLNILHLQEDLTEENGMLNSRFASVFNNLYDEQRTRYKQLENDMARDLQNYRERIEEFMYEVRNREVGAEEAIDEEAEVDEVEESITSEET